MAKCNFIKTNGLKCKANSIIGSYFCFSHNPDIQEAKLAAVKKGGLNRKHYQAYGQELALETPQDIKNLIAQTINGVWTGNIPANQPANTIGFLARCWIDTYSTYEIEERLSKVEKDLDNKK